MEAPRIRVITQSLLAVVTIGIILFIVQGLAQEAIVVALGASAFIVFGMPHSLMARPRRLIGGHAVGTICGILCYYTFIIGFIGKMGATPLLIWLASAVAIGLSIFLMAVTNTGHPPAASTALGFVVNGWSYQTIVFVLLCAVCLAVARRLLKSRLINLF